MDHASYETVKRVIKNDGTKKEEKKKRLGVSWKLQRGAKTFQFPLSRFPLTRIRCFPVRTSLFLSAEKTFHQLFYLSYRTAASYRRVLFLLRLVSFLFSLFFQSTRTLPGKTQTRSIGKPFFSHDLYPTLRVTAWCCISVTLFFALIWRYISPFTSHVECNTEPSDIQVTCWIFPAFFAIFTLASFILMRSLCQCTGTENETKGECIVIYTRIPHPFCRILRLFLLLYSYVLQVHSPKI